MKTLVVSVLLLLCLALVQGEDVSKIRSRLLQLLAVQKRQHSPVSKLKAAKALESKAVGTQRRQLQSCDNSCKWRNDGECDDGGPVSVYSVCELGTDCNDCRACDNSCFWHNDGACDDGSPDSQYSVCDLGTDCDDCREQGGWQPPTPEWAGWPQPTPGWAGWPQPTPEWAGWPQPTPGWTGWAGGSTTPSTQGAPGCYDDTCPYLDDDECDDGGPGSVTSLCLPGTDCNDCNDQGGGGQPDWAGWSGQSDENGQGSDEDWDEGCNDTCQYSLNGECDEGSSLCDDGTDCTDCEYAMDYKRRNSVHDLPATPELRRKQKLKEAREMEVLRRRLKQRMFRKRKPAKPKPKKEP